MKLKSLIQTCRAAPSQWEGQLEDGRVVYIRYRWGSLQVGIGEDLDEAISTRKHIWDGPNDFDGVMSEAKMLQITGFHL